MQRIIFNQTITKNIGEEFTKCYYDKIGQGVNMIVDFFHPKALCSLYDNEIIGGYNLFLKYINLGIARCEYSKISGCTQTVNDKEILITVTGVYRTVGYWGQTSPWLQFNEVFILENIGNIGEYKYVIKNYIVRLV